jgi:hypothetical protein
MSLASGSEQGGWWFKSTRPDQFFSIALDDEGILQKEILVN